MKTGLSFCVFTYRLTFLIKDGAVQLLNIRTFESTRTTCELKKIGKPNIYGCIMTASRNGFGRLRPESYSNNRSGLNAQNGAPLAAVKQTVCEEQ